MLFIRQMVDNDLVVLSKSITEGDLEELRVFDKEITVIDALELSVENSLCYTVSDDFGTVYAVGGTSSQGAAWFITSNNIELLTHNETCQFISILKQHRDVCLKTHRFLFNCISTKNVKHIRLLKLLGATFRSTDIDGVAFFKITRGGQ
ncbi:MAG: hypothetical protein [Caudoviricetes sp.]|nr:MAG: hypothetical protein [Caudoviricetes sp.]